ADIKVDTQHTTLNNKYIDLLIYNEKYILVFENKIFHWLANPLDEYVNDIQQRYPKLTPYFFVLSQSPIKTPLNWPNILIKDIFTHIKNNVNFSFTNKWDYFISDFLNHYIEDNFNMNQEEFDFYKKNFARIIAANNVTNVFIEETINKVKSFLPEGSISKQSGINDWGNKYSRAVRLYPIDKTENNVVLIFREDGKFNISAYYYKDYVTHYSEIHKAVGSQNYKCWDEVRKSIVCLTLHDNCLFVNLDDAIQECCLQLEKMQSYFMN
ncbi:MAG: hypothetical protein Q8909_18950, partial [Bacteroidota bacterium]|nr:hypothetical protein [Bacteroidota bacterium]